MPILRGPSLTHDELTDWTSGIEQRTRITGLDRHLGFKNSRKKGRLRCVGHIDRVVESLCAKDVGMPHRVRPTKLRGLALLDEDMSQSIGFIQTFVVRLSRIIDALLRLSRAGRVVYEWLPIDLEGTVGTIITSMAGTIDEKGAQITVASLP